MVTQDMVTHDPRITVRPATPEDARAMAEVHVTSWQETYRGLMSDETLGDPAFVERRERMWTTVLRDERYREHRVAVAVENAVGGDGHGNAAMHARGASRIVGIAMSGPPPESDDSTDLPCTRHLYVLYTLAAVHGRGAGTALAESVLHPAETVSLWVADPNPRAQAFYRKLGFTPDGVELIDETDGFREIRMIRRHVSR